MQVKGRFAGKNISATNRGANRQKCIRDYAEKMIKADSILQKPADNGTKTIEMPAKNLQEIRRLGHGKLQGRAGEGVSFMGPDGNRERKPEGKAARFLKRFKEITIIF